MIVLYLVLGTFMEELSMMISTIPITTPLILQAGYDPVWFGILLVLLIQTAMVTPPFGINLFVIHGIRGRGTLSDVELGSAPFVVALLVMIGSDLRLSRPRHVAAARGGLAEIVRRIGGGGGPLGDDELGGLQHRRPPAGKPGLHSPRTPVGTRNLINLRIEEGGQNRDAKLRIQLR